MQLLKDLIRMRNARTLFSGITTEYRISVITANVVAYGRKW